MIDVIDLGLNTRKWRKKNGISQTALASLALCSRGTISRTELGKTDIRMSTYNRLAEIISFNLRVKFWDYEKHLPFIYADGWHDQNLFLDVIQAIYKTYDVVGFPVKVFLMRKPRDYGYMTVPGSRCGAIKATVIDIRMD